MSGSTDRNPRAGNGPVGLSSVEEVYASGLCHGCGTCAGVCPVGAIEMGLNDIGNELRPYLAQDECTSCGLCLEVCPGIGVDFGELNQEAFGCQPEDPLIGVARAAWVAHSSDKELRFNASSGGVVTELCAFLLEEKWADGVVVVDSPADAPLRPRPVIATSREELVAAAGSKYCPVAVNTILRELRSGDGRYALVGLPCHIHGLRKAMRRDERLRSRIRYSLGPFCGGTSNFLATEYYLSRKGIRLHDVDAFRFRSKGWPGSISVTLKDGQERVYPKRFDVDGGLYLGLQHMAAYGFRQFRPWRCITCCDHAAELADVSFCDPWLPSYIKQERVGRTFVLARSEKGEGIVEAAAAAGRLVADEVPIEDVIESQIQLLRSKKALAAPLRASRLVGLRVPEYVWRVRPAVPASLGYSAACLAAILERWLGRHRWAWPLIFPWASLRSALRIPGKALKKVRRR